jgi:hypothetical protein
MESNGNGIVSLSYAYAAIVGATVLLITLVASYRRAASTSGLAKLPGPGIARYSNIWRVWNAQSGNAPQRFQELHRTYGTVVRIGPNHVAISEPAMVPVIYGVSSKFVKVCKP